jgi:hypothetical protein
MMRQTLSWVGAGALAALVVGGCSSSSSGFPNGGDDTNDAGSTPETTPDAQAVHDANTPPVSADAACGTRVNSGIKFSASGEPLCDATNPCDLTKNTCCVGITGAGTCTTGHNGCGGALDATLECVEDTDCPTNQVCCGFFDMSAGMAGSKCQDVSGNGNKCSPAPTATQDSVQFCQKTCECKDGSECIPQNCNVGLPIPAHLTMCGLQQMGSYNCTQAN